SPQAAHRAAESILSEARFHNSPVPDPLHGVLVWLGNAVSDPLGSLGGFINKVGSSFPGGIAFFWVVAAMLLVVVTILLVSRRARTQLARSQTTAKVHRPRAAELEHNAELAEREGHWEEAVRLRFGAGLLRLSEQDRVRFTESTPNHSLARQLDSEPLEQLSTRFDEIVYGGDAATADDAACQREVWPKVIAGSKP
ncbi:MAG TPA: hypothetical protein VME01_07315, partial [Solirubrobacteraceae bacterium]|nr:hypothetical protein [Solirubrobacteraceae bacterium]